MPVKWGGQPVEVPRGGGIMLVINQFQAKYSRIQDRGLPHCGCHALVINFCVVIPSLVTPPQGRQETVTYYENKGGPI